MSRVSDLINVAPNPLYSPARPRVFSSSTVMLVAEGRWGGAGRACVGGAANDGAGPGAAAWAGVGTGLCAADE